MFMLGVLKTILKTVLKYEKNTITLYGTCWNWAADFVFLLRFCTRKRSKTYKFTVAPKDHLQPPSNLHRIRWIPWYLQFIVASCDLGVLSIWILIKPIGFSSTKFRKSWWTLSWKLNWYITKIDQLCFGSLSYVLYCLLCNILNPLQLEGHKLRKNGTNSHLTYIVEEVTDDMIRV